MKELVVQKQVTGEQAEERPQTPKLGAATGPQSNAEMNKTQPPGAMAQAMAKQVGYEATSQGDEKVRENADIESISNFTADRK